MSQTEYSFLDFSVMPFLRRRVLSANAVILFSANLDRVLWANAVGTQLFGGDHVIDLLETRLSAKKPLVRQLAHAATQLRDGESIVRTFSIARGLKSDTVRGEFLSVILPNEEKALLLVCEPHDNSHRFREHELAEMCVESLDGFADAAAIIDEYGLIVASSRQFDAFEIDSVTLEMLVKMVAREDDRLVKRPVETGDGETIAAGLGRIRDMPARFIVVLADGLSSTSDNEEPVLETGTISGDNRDGDTAALLGETLSDADLPPWLAPSNENAPEEPDPTQTFPTDPGLKAYERSHEDENENAVAETQPPDQSEKARGEEASSTSLLDRWYFADGEPGKSGQKDDASLAAQQATSGSESPESTSGADTHLKPVPEGHPVRFAFTIGRDGVLKSVSSELPEIVGPKSGDIVGLSWRELAMARGFDESGAIASLLERADTWSGKSVLWPVDGTDMLIPIDLAALPSFDRDRQFDGFRGFGIIRSEDAIVDPHGSWASAVDRPDTVETAPSSTEEPLQEHDPIQPVDQNGISGWHQGEDQGALKDLTKDSPSDDFGAEALGEADNPVGENVFHLPNYKPVSSQKIDNPDQPNEHGETVEGDDGDIANALSGREKRAFDEISRNLSENEKETPTAEAVEASSYTVEPAETATPEPLAAVFNDLDFPVLVYRTAGTLFANGPFLKMTGYETAQELGDAGGIEALLASSQEKDAFAVAGGTTIRTKSGDNLSVNSRLTKIKWQDEDALCLTFSQISDTESALQSDGAAPEKAALDMMRVSELENILETAADGLMIIDADGRIESLNTSGEALFGRDQSEVIGKPFSSLFATESKKVLETHLETLKEPGVPGVMNQGQEVIGIEAQGRLIPMFALIGKVGNSGRYCAVLRDLTDWKKTEEELVEAKRKAETASDQKSDFLSRVSHEIREPLTSIIGFSDVMIEERFGKIDNPRYREYLKDINRSGIHVLDLVNDLLDISKIEAGKLDLSYEAVDLNQLAGETVALLQPKANNKRIIIRTSLSRAVPKVVADARSIRQIILNLVSNAIHHSERNSQVIVSTTYEENGEVALRVRDTGSGMSESELERALEPFSQVSDERHETGAGTGLGLPLTKALVEANRAYFELESQKGEGTIAHIQFPSQRVLAD